VLEKLEQTGICALLPGGEFYLDDFATHFHNPLLFAKPVVVRNYRCVLIRVWLGTQAVTLNIRMGVLLL
jgi:hypothetical protein